MSRTPDLHAKISLLRAAEDVFAQKGLALAKVEEISRRAGLSKGAFYLHFDSKEDAFKEVVESFLARCAAIFRAPEDAGVGALPDGPAEMLAYSLDRDEHAFEFLWQNRHIITIIERCNGPHEYLLDTYLEVIRQNTGAWCDAWRQRGLFRADLDTGLAAILLVGAYRGLVRKLIASAVRPPIRAWLAEAQDLFVRGLGSAKLATAAAEEARPREEKKVRNGT